MLNETDLDGEPCTLYEILDLVNAAKKFLFSIDMVNIDRAYCELAFVKEPFTKYDNEICINLTVTIKNVRFDTVLWVGAIRKGDFFIYTTEDEVENAISKICNLLISVSKTFIFKLESWRAKLINRTIIHEMRYDG